MYIEPNSNIRILKNCPLDTSYDHTIYWSSLTNQINYFMSLTKYSFTEQTYTRVNKGSIRVERKAEDLYDCNYLMFQNASFGNKWFYAFITSVEYVNNVTSEITFQIDVMQTWFFDYTLKECFVEREHSATDNIGENIIDEPVSIGDYKIAGIQDFTEISPTVMVVACTITDSGSKYYNGHSFNGVFSGYNYIGWTKQGYYVDPDTGEVDTARNIRDWIGTIQADPSKTDFISMIFTMPKVFFTGYDDTTGGGLPKTVSKSISKKYNDIDGYIPKNKKLFTYPYNFLQVTNNMTATADFRYEFFSGSSCTFNASGSTTVAPEIALYPKNYKGSERGSSIQFDPSETLYLSNYPQLTWQTDVCSAWLAQIMSSVQNTAVDGLISGVGIGMARYGQKGKTLTSANSSQATGSMYFGRGFAKGLRGELRKSADDIVDSLKDGFNYLTTPNQVHGADCGAGISRLARNRYTYTFVNKQITHQYAKTIDDFFTVYGYATKLTKVPNTHSRPHWNYVETRNCVITGSVPADDMKDICDIYDHGITFWKHGSEIGNYSLDNRP